MMGIAANHKSDSTETVDLIDYWPDKYNDYSNYIIGILFVEAKNVGIDISNSDTTTNHLNNFLTLMKGQNYLLRL